MASTELIRRVNEAELLHAYSVIRAGQPNWDALLPYYGMLLLINATGEDIWTATVDHLLAGGYELNQNLFEFHYDWRKKLQLDENFSSLDSVLQVARDLNTESAGALTVVSHSLGGLLTRAYANNKISNDQDPGIHTWITLGTPFEGSVDAFASLMSLNQLGFDDWPVVGNLIADHMGDIARHSAALYTLLPSGDFAQNHAIYENGDDCSYICVHPHSPSQLGTFNDVLGGYVDMPDNWNPVQDVMERRNVFLSEYNAPTGIPNIFHVINNGYDTLSRITRHWESGLPMGYDSYRFNLDRKILGDHTVPEPSLAAGEPGAGIYLLDHARHANMPASGAAADFILKKAIDPTAWNHGLVEYPGQALGRRSLLFQFKLMLGNIFRGRDTIPIPMVPVTFELINLESGELLVGAFHLLEEDGSPSEISACMALSEGAWAGAAEDQLFLSLPIEDGDYRLVLLPDPDFWYPVEDGPNLGFLQPEDEFEIYGQLVIDDVNSTWTAPGSEDGDLIHFYDVDAGGHPFGFSAIMDFAVENGDIQGIHLDLFIDQDGDGDEDGLVGILFEDVPPMSGASELGLFPNPFNPSVTIHWNHQDESPAGLEIHDCAGRLIRRIDLDSGKESYVWDGTGPEGKRLPSGAYLIRAVDHSGKTLAAGKAMMLK